MIVKAPAAITRQMPRSAAVDRIDAAMAAKQEERAALWAQTKHRGRRLLPPYGRQWIDAGRRYGPFVICGPGAWAMAERRKHSGFAMVAPDDQDPLDFDWTLLSGRQTVLVEAGGFDAPRLERVAFALLAGGVPLVFPVRTVMLDQHPPQVWSSYARDDYVGPL